MSLLADKTEAQLYQLLKAADREEKRLLAPVIEAELERRKTDWSSHARPEQLPPPGDWLVWLILAGRGWGKTRTGAEWVKKQALEHPGTRWAVVGPTFSDVKAVCFEGESGLKALFRAEDLRGGSWDKAYNSSEARLVLANGSIIQGYYAERPDRLRGPQHHGAWCDELAAWRYPEMWDQLQFGLRLGTNPQTVVTTTPRPTKLIRDLVARDRGVHVTRGSTFDNAANLAPAALEEMRARYEGSRLGRQELHAELLTDVPGALTTLDELDAVRVREVPELLRVLISVDPAVTNTPESDETGIAVQGRGLDGHCYLIDDLSCRVDVDVWARRAVDAAQEHLAGVILYEQNQGADAIGSVLRQAMRDMGVTDVAIEPVRAEKSKFDRALPLQQAIQQGRWHPVGSFPELEEQLTTWTIDSKSSPDRIDAAVHGFTKLMLAPDKPKLRFRG